MAVLNGRLVEIFQLEEERAGVLNLPEGYWLQPGQFLPCQNPAVESAVLPTNLFRVIGPKDQLCVGPIPSEWRPGDKLACLSPQGNGFHPPDSARRIGLLALGVPPVRLLTLVGGAMAQNAALTLFCNPAPPADILRWVPPQVEITSLESFQDSLDWLDFLAVDIQHNDLDELTSLLSSTHPPFSGQVLVRTAMPCRGLGACGVCAVKTHHGWRLVCMDGPVFPLKVLLHVAG